MRYRTFDGSEGDLAEVVRLANETNPDSPKTLEEVKRDDANRDPSKQFERVMVYDGERPIGFFSFGDEEDCHVDGKKFFRLTLPDGNVTPDRIEGCYRELLRRLAGARIIVLESWTRSDRAVGPELERLGFVRSLTCPVTELKLDGFDPSDARWGIDRPAAQGYEVISSREAQTRFDDWLKLAYDADIDISRDVPTTDPFVPWPFEYFKKWFVEEECDFDCSFFAVKDDQIVALSQLWRVEAVPDRRSTGLTGVRRSHRKRGLATALKARALGAAKERGVTHVWTDNEENNPMLTINKRLGFREIHRFVELRKEIDPT